jgi:hypothetical protein
MSATRSTRDATETPGLTPTETADGAAAAHARVIAADRSCRWCGGRLHAGADDGTVAVVCTDCGRDFV